MAVRVVYTDPMWALQADGSTSPSAAHIEREVFGDDIEIDLGCVESGSFVTSGERFNAFVEGAGALVIYRAQITPDVVAAIAPTCRVVARQGVGVDNLRADLLRAAGIYAFNVPDYCVDEVSSHTLALLLALERGVCHQNENLKRGAWDPFGGGRPRRMATRAVGIVGFGRIGRATARKAQPFYRSVLVHDPYVPADLVEGYGCARCDSLQELLALSDAVVLHAPLDDSTRFMIDGAALRHARPGALLVNTARGELVATAAVVDALDRGAIGGFASDVFSPEDPNDDAVNQQLLRFDNVVVTSHRAFLSHESERSQRLRVAEEVAAVLRTGRAPLFGRLA
jgi:phosphoglycerate dehydrogenase-like enzyme